jgi:hypothetical protein
MECNDFKLLFDDRFSVLLCRECCLMFVDGADDGRWADYYKIGYYRGIHQSRINSLSNLRLIQWLEKNMDGLTGKKVLEIGCGQGSFLKEKRIFCQGLVLLSLFEGKFICEGFAYQASTHLKNPAQESAYLVTGSAKRRKDEKAPGCVAFTWTWIRIALQMG